MNVTVIPRYTIKNSTEVKATTGDFAGCPPPDEDEMLIYPVRFTKWYIKAGIHFLLAIF